MTPKEKAIELINKYYNQMNPEAPDCNISFNQCKQCALICVDEIINCDSFFKSLQYTREFTAYWYAVQDEINKL